MALAADQQPISRALHAVLTVRCQHKALGIVTLAGKNQGFKAWKGLLAEYEPQAGNRYAAVLTSLLNPPWATDERLFADAIVDWDNSIARYEIQSGK